MIDIDDLVARLRAKGEWSSDKLWESDPDSTEAADALEAQAKRIAELESTLKETKSLLPQNINEAPSRPPFVSDWWSVAVLERRKRRGSEREYNARIAELKAQNELILSANNELGCVFEERDEALARISELEAALDKAEAALSWMLLEGIDEVIPETCPKEYKSCVDALDDLRRARTALKQP